jgi:hypothetical protein
VLLVAGILLILAGTSTGPGRVLATIFDVIKTLYEAGQAAIGIIWIPVGIVIIAVMVGVPLFFVGGGVYFFVGFVFRGFRREPEEGTGLKYLTMGLVLLAFEAYMAYMVIQNRELMMNEWLAPFRTIVGWFS